MTEKNTPVRSGRVYSINPKPLNDSGQDGYYWSRTGYLQYTGPSSSVNYARYLNFSHSNFVNVSGSFARYLAFSLRCLAS